jgi:hypothetical protein
MAHPVRSAAKDACGEQPGLSVTVVRLGLLMEEVLAPLARNVFNRALVAPWGESGVALLPCPGAQGRPSPRGSRNRLQSRLRR